MEFEEMQVIWNSETQEKQYVINKDALYRHIQGKGRSVNRLMGFVDLLLIAGNLLAGVAIAFDAYFDNGEWLQFVLAAMYIAYSLFALVRRLTRRRKEVHFEQTMVGELNKAIWQIDYLIQQGRSMLIWYGIPLILVAVIILLPDSLIWALALLLVLAPATYFATRWEINRHYMPKKRELESLRATLVSES